MCGSLTARGLRQLSRSGRAASAEWAPPVAAGRRAAGGTAGIAHFGRPRNRRLKGFLTDPHGIAAIEQTGEPVPREAGRASTG